MAKTIRWALAATLLMSGIFYFNSCCCSLDDDNEIVNPVQEDLPLQVGSYVWGSTIYDMGPDGAEILAEAYEKAGINRAILLVKGESGEVGYLKNTLSNAPLARTDRDILEEAITAMHQHGIKVYAWLTVGTDGSYAADNPLQRSYHFRKGYFQSYIDLAQTDYHQYMANIVKEIDENYKIDGFVFDMVRYMGTYLGWADSDFERLTASVDDGGYGLSLDDYNNLVSIFAQQYQYPTSYNSNGRLVYDDDELQPDEVFDTLYKAYEQGVPCVVAFGKMREKIVDDISIYLKNQTQRPCYVSSMAECTYAPNAGTVAYGMTFNQSYTYDVVCPMLYTTDYSADATWVKENIDYLKNLGYSKILPSLQAYKNGTTATLNDDIKATLEDGCMGYLLFRTNTYDMARATKTQDGAVEITYIRGTQYSSGDITITLKGATPQTVTMGCNLATTQYSIDGPTITFNADALNSLGDYGTITIRFLNGKQPTSINVESDKRIVYNAPFE